MQDVDRARVSVCIPVFRPVRKHLLAALDSLRIQATPPFQVVVTDDGSDFDVQSVLVASNLPNATYSRNRSRLGLVNNWNRCVQLSDQPFALVLSQDDALAESHISEHMELLQLHKDVVVSSSHRQLVDAQGRSLREQGVSRIEEGFVLVHPKFWTPRSSDRIC